MVGRPGGDKVPSMVYRYLLPQERRVIAVRRHPVILSGFLAFLASAVGAAGLLTAARRKDVAALRGAWGASGIALFLAGIRLYAWLNSYIVVTDARLLYVKSFAGIKVSAIPVSDISSIDLRQPLLGRLFGYGTLVINSPGSALKIRFLPYLEQIYLEIYGLLVPGSEEDDD